MEDKIYIIKRPCLWFAKNDEVSEKKLLEYYTDKGLDSLEVYGFIEEKK